MTDSSSPQDSPAPSGGPASPRGSSQRSVGSAIDSAWDSFEEAWNGGQRPRIEDFLSRVPDEEQWEMLRALVKLEWALREQSAESPKTEEYRERFPQFDEQLLREFGESSCESPYGQQLGDYRLLERLGGGGMGDVYKAEHVRLSKTVALKVLASRALGDPHAIARFENEMRLIGRLNDHENLVRASDAREENGIHFLVMEYVDGVDLEQLVRRTGPLNFNVACELIRQAAVGLQHVHEHGLVHRDIKPSNLILNSSGRVKILDLGLARLQSSNPEATRLTQPGFALGTVDYMAPEQWDDSGSVDIRADIYSLGCTMYYLLTGSAPYSGPELSSIKKKLMAHAAAPVPSVIERRPECPEEIDWTIKKLLAKEADERVDAPGEVAEAVQTFASTKAVSVLLSTQLSARPSSHIGTDVLVKSALTDTEGKLARKLAPTMAGMAVDGGSRGFSRRRFAGVMAGLLVVLAGAAALFFQGPKVHPLRADLGALPGLNGDWWFDETPWYTPGIRSELMKAVDAREPLVGDRSPLKVLEAARGADTGTLYADLRRMARPLTVRLPTKERDITGELIAIDPAMHDQGEYLDLIGPIADELSEREDLSATEMHLFAVLQHKLGRAKQEDVQAAYQRALDLYQQEGQGELYALCASDLARYCFARKQYGRAVRCFEDGAAHFVAAQGEAGETSLAPAWRMAAICLQADAQRRRGYADKALSLLKSAEKIKGLEKGHPLHAYVHEREAWAHLDLWELEEAIGEFMKADKLRGKQEDEATKVRRFWIQQGIAMATHFVGDQDEALWLYKELAEKIRAELNPQGKGFSVAGQALSPHARSVFRGRQPNVYERWADALLFGRKPDYAEAARKLEFAQHEAEEVGFARQGDPRAPYLYVIQYKRLIAELELLDGRDVAPILKRFQQLESQEIVSLSEGKQRSIVDFPRELARAVISLKTDDVDFRQTGFVELRKLLDDEKVKAGKVSRSNLDVVLLAIETMAKSEQLDSKALARAARRLYQVYQATQKPEVGARQLDIYLGRYFDSVLAAITDHGYEEGDLLHAEYEKLRQARDQMD